jgi:hypothetical protein
MLQSIRNLLRKKSFWGWLAAINIFSVLVGGWALVVPGTLAILLLLVTVLAIGNFVHSRAFPKIMKWTGILFAWFITGGIVSVVFEAAGMSIKNDWVVVGILVVNLLLWIVPVLFFRWLKRHRRARESWQMQQDSEQTARRQYSAQKRRADARARCELFYNLHGPELSPRLNHKQFEDFWKRHLGDEQTPEYVEERAAQLLDTMQKHLEKAGHREQKKSIADIAAWFLEEKTKIDRLPLNPEDKEQMIADLEARFTQLQQKYIRSMNP